MEDFLFTDFVLTEFKPLQVEMVLKGRWIGNTLCSISFNIFHHMFPLKEVILAIKKLKEKIQIGYGINTCWGEVLPYPRINRARNNVEENCGGVLENVLSRKELDLVFDIDGVWGGREWQVNEWTWCNEIRWAVSVGCSYCGNIAVPVIKQVFWYTVLKDVIITCTN